MQIDVIAVTIPGFAVCTAGAETLALGSVLA
jgi:hypothetical protein